MILDDLTFIKPIGKGSFGQVYLTSKANLQEYFATKVIKKLVADSPKVKKYFHNEIEILKEINHKNIMKLLEVKQNSENYYLVCEFCNGGSLHQNLDKYLKMYRKPFSEEITQFLMKQIIEGLKYLHGKHIIHRDLKLDNILVNFKNPNDKSILNMYGAEVKIIDFGFAAHVDNKTDLHKSVLGSPLYMDPRLLKKYTKNGNIDITGYDEKIDIWSLGNLCYEMLMGRPAFETIDIKILEQKIEKGFYNLPTTLYNETVGFLIGMLQYDPKIRLSSEKLSKHDFLTKNIRHFTRIDIIKMKDYIKDNKLVLNINEDSKLWNMFNSKYNRVLEIIPEDSDVSESYMSIINHKEKDNPKEKELKSILKRAFEKMNEDFLHLPPIFIPLVPGNDPKDKYNEEKQI